MMKHGIYVAVIGFTSSDQDRLKRIFQYSKSRDRSYLFSDQSSNSIDILLVNIDNGEAESQQQDILQKHPETSVVTASSERPANGSNHHIQGPLLSTRVLRILDTTKIQDPQPQISLQVPEPGEAAEIPSEQAGQSQADNTFDVLVVDDSLSMQKALEIELGQVPMPINIDFADSGEQALERVGKKPYHFIFLDIMMPGIDGFETCTTIRKNPAMKKTPIIMLSAKTSPLDEVKGVMAGCTTYLTKPIIHDDFQKLIIRIMEWLENFQQK